MSRTNRNRLVKKKIISCTMSGDRFPNDLEKKEERRHFTAVNQDLCRNFFILDFHSFLQNHSILAMTIIHESEGMIHNLSILLSMKNKNHFRLFSSNDQIDG